MADTTFLGTSNPISKEWAQDVNDYTYVTNDTGLSGITELQLAVNASAAAGRPLYIRNAYTFSTTLTIPSNTHLI